MGEVVLHPTAHGQEKAEEEPGTVDLASFIQAVAGRYPLEATVEGKAYNFTLGDGILCYLLPQHPDDDGRRAHSVLLRTGFQSGEFPAERGLFLVNRFNSRMLHARAFWDSDGLAILEMDIWSVDGTAIDSAGAARKAMSVWEGLVHKFVAMFSAHHLVD